MSRTRNRSKHRREPPARPAAGLRHQPVWLRQECSLCRAPCRMAEESIGGRLRGALLELEPQETGILVRRPDGYVVRDPGSGVPGKRYKWHNCPVRNAEDQPRKGGG